MIDTTWNRLNLMIKRGDLNNTERHRLLLSCGCDGLNISFGCVTQLCDQRLKIVHSTHRAWQDTEFDLHQTLCQFTLAHGELVASPNLTDSDWKQHDITDQWQLRAYIGIPIKMRDVTYGTVFFGSYDTRPQAFSNRDKAFLQMMVGSFRVLIQQESGHR